MKISEERFDERFGQDENGNYICCETGIVYTFAKRGSKLTFRIKDENPSVAEMLEPQGWYIDQFGSKFFKEAVAYLRCNTEVTTVHAYSAMRSQVYEHQIEE